VRTHEYVRFPRIAASLFKTSSADNAYSSIGQEFVFFCRRRFMSPDARLMCGISLILVPTIVYGGLTILGVVSNRLYGVPGPTNLSPSQVAFYRAGHAHAGVLTLLALFLQIGLDFAAIPHVLVWPARVAAVAAALLVSGGFFAVAHVPALRGVLYAGAVLVAATTLTVGIGLILAR
jgi:hypothetical protein